jgi:hypothetical protein
MLITAVRLGKQVVSLLFLLYLSLYMSVLSASVREGESDRDRQTDRDRERERFSREINKGVSDGQTLTYADVRRTRRYGGCGIKERTYADVC